MNQKLLEEYAKVIVHEGIRVEKGEEIWVYANLDQPEFVSLVVEECYKSGAKLVEVLWSYQPVDRLSYKYESLSTLSKLRPFSIARWKYAAKKMPTKLYLVSDDPDALKGVNQSKLSKSKMKWYPKIKPFRDAMDGHYKWCIVAVPGVKWAKKIFPELSNEEAMEKLWEAILKCTRIEENNSMKNWLDHNQKLMEQRNKLKNLNLKYLEYKSVNGTDFKVELIEGANWGGGEEKTAEGKWYNPNMPTEEVFTSPKYGSCEGKLVATKPLCYNGQLIEDFAISFANGKVCKVEAKKNQKILEEMVKMDEGASMLGEVALVPYTSPINQSGILFYETLFDENACCHVALGAGFGEILDGGTEMSTEELKKRGINDSMIHVDFMIGSKDLSIIGITKEGKRVQIFKDGVWAI